MHPFRFAPGAQAPAHAHALFPDRNTACNGSRWMPAGLAAPGFTAAQSARSARQLAALQCAVWEEAFVTLRRLIGAQGVSALFRRSLWLCRQDDPGLALMHEHYISLELALARLQEQMAGQSPSVAAATQSILVQRFCELLSRLIGPALAERLLRPVLWPLWRSLAGMKEPS